jgi:hypothetical protein
MKYDEIEDNMSKFGYKYDRSVRSWVNKKTGITDKRKRKKVKYSKYTKPKEKKKEKIVQKVVFIPKDEKKDDTPVEVPIKQDKPKEPVGKREYGTNIKEKPVIEWDIMDAQSRLILFVIHDIKETILYKDDKPVLSSSAILETMEDYNYVWDRKNIIWKINDTYPQISKYDQNVKSLTARALSVKVFEHKKSLEFYDEKFTYTNKDIYNALLDSDWKWNNESNIWEKGEE